MGQELIIPTTYLEIKKNSMRFINRLMMQQTQLEDSQTAIHSQTLDHNLERTMQASAEHLPDPVQDLRKSIYSRASNFNSDDHYQRHSVKHI